MNTILKVASYLFHPLWMPFAGTLLYFLISPRFFPEEVIQAKLIAVAIMTLFIPIVFYFLLKTLRKVDSYFLKEAEERRWPLLFYTALILVILKFVLNSTDYPELYYYFFGLLLSTIAALVLVWFRIKVSLHLMGLGGLFMFLTGLGIHFSIDLVYTLSFFIAVTGLTASSRLHMRAHSSLELLAGFLIGLLPQILILPSWL